MNETRPKRWQPSRTSLAAGASVIAGFWLSSFSWWFFILVGVGAFGPGLLRELGLLNDRDEFQRRADQRAGYHAFLTTGLVATGLVAFFRSGDRPVQDTQELATLFLVFLWFTWLLSTFVSYWGAQKASLRILNVFGAVILAFTLISNLGSEWTGWTALLLHPLIALPFFALAWLSGHWPRIAGLLLLILAVFFFQFFKFFGRDNFSIVNEAVIFTILLCPLIAAGVALLVARNQDEEIDNLDQIALAGE